MFIYFLGNWHLCKTINKRSSSRNADSISHGNQVRIYCLYVWEFLSRQHIYCSCHYIVGNTTLFLNRRVIKTLTNVTNFIRKIVIYSSIFRIIFRSSLKHKTIFYEMILRKSVQFMTQVINTDCKLNFFIYIRLNCCIPLLLFKS